MTEEQPTGHLHWSDHGAFRDAGVPILWFANGLNKHYHERTDSVEKLNFANMALQAQYLYDIAKNLGESPMIPSYNPAAADYINDANVAIEAINAVSSPHTKAPAPRCNWISKSKPDPKMFRPSSPHWRA